GCSASQIAVDLNKAGWRTPEGTPFSAGSVRTLVSRYGLTKVGRRAQELTEVLGPNEHLIPDLVRLLDVAYPTVYGWIKRGWVEARQLAGSHGRWVIHADQDKLVELRARAANEQRQTANPKKPVTGGVL